MGIVISIIIIAALCMGFLWLIIDTTRNIRIAVSLITLAICVVTLLTYTNTASFQRSLTNIRSELNAGIEREIKLFNSEGELLFEDYGRFDFTYDEVSFEYINMNTGLKTNIFPGEHASIIINEVRD